MTAKKCTKKRDVGTLKLLFCQSKPIVFCRYRWHRRLRCLSSVCFLSNTRSFSFVFWTERDVKTGIVICMLAALIKLVALVASTAKDLSVIIAWSFQKIPNKSMSTAPMVKTRAGVQRQPIDRLYALQSSKTFIRNDYWLLRLGFKGLCLFFLSLPFLLYSWATGKTVLWTHSFSFNSPVLSSFIILISCPIPIVTRRTRKHCKTRWWRKTKKWTQ